MVTTLELKNTFSHIDEEGQAYIIGDLLGGENIKREMKRYGEKWIYTTNLPDGRYRYKFLVDDIIRINDSEASCYEIDEYGEVWSVIIVKEDRKMSLRSEKIYFDNLTIVENKNSISQVGRIPYISALRTSYVHAIVSINGGFGLHNVTILWIEPTGTIFQTDEIGLSIDDIPYPVSKIETDLNIKNTLKFYPSGKWYVHIYLDGEFGGAGEFYLDMGYGYTSTVIDCLIG